MFLLILIIASIPVFFYKLSQSSLNNWDEAWYAEIAKQIGISGDFLVMRFGGKVFTDHPPAGFWIISIFQSIFGVNEFGSRVGGAIFGVICILGVYFLGKKLFSSTVGFCASIAILSAPWFVLRARSGNLDVFLVAFFVWSIYFAFLSIENKKYLSHLSIVLSLLFLSKTMVPFAIIPSLILIFHGSRVKVKHLARPIAFFFVFTLPWVIANFFAKPDFIARYLKIGLPGVKRTTAPIDNIAYVKEYLHNGIGKFFWPGILGAIGGALTFKKKFLVLFVLVVSLVLPFVFSEKGHIWHMIPIYPFLLLLLFGFGSFIGKKILKFSLFVNLGLIAFTLWIFIPQARANWYNFIDIPGYISDEAILSTKAGEYTEPLFIDGDFVPVATFYSNKVSVKKVLIPLPEFFENSKEFLLITHENKIKREVDSALYEVIAKDRDKVLVISLP